ncbi:MAG: ABC transporter ATP-binding protein/permease [Oscillospiraceae bacterium]|nr:ABC transporter ATP-binding protein/permease [Oscillospiraceae bacterium]
MHLTNRQYRGFEVIDMAFHAAPVSMVLQITLSVINSLIPTIATALTTAYFVNTATDILGGNAEFAQIYSALTLVLIVLAIYFSIEPITKLLSLRIKLLLTGQFMPMLVEMHASLDYKHIEDNQTQELLSHIERDPITSLSKGIDGYLSLMRMVFSIASILTVIAVQVWWAALVIVVFSTPMLFLALSAGKKNYQAGREAERYSRRADYFKQLLTERDTVNERVIYSYTNMVDHRYEQQFETARKLKAKVQAKMFVISKSGSMVLAIVTLFIALMLINPVVTGRLTSGMFIGLVGSVFSVVTGIGWQLADSLENISGVSEFMKELTEFLSLSRTDNPEYDSCTLPLSLNSLEFREVRFNYPNSNDYILDGISFRLEAGKHYSLVGANGAGKTTITKLLTGLYTDYDGEILINDRELRQYSSDTLKATFSVVYQDFAKYYIPLKANILLGDLSGTGDYRKVKNAAEKAGLAETLSSLENGIDTPLGRILEAGPDISGGEWQRVAFARSFMSDAPVKILDEPTASLDPISESRIYSEFEILMRDKTTIFISHRLASTKLADEILVIDEGRVIEKGTHEQLMEHRGFYHRMYESQQGWYI